MDFFYHGEKNCNTLCSVAGGFNLQGPLNCEFHQSLYFGTLIQVFKTTRPELWLTPASAKQAGRQAGRRAGEPAGHHYSRFIKLSWSYNQCGREKHDHCLAHTQLPTTTLRIMKGYFV